MPAFLRGEGLCGQGLGVTIGPARCAVAGTLGARTANTAPRCSLCTLAQPAHKSFWVAQARQVLDERGEDLLHDVLRGGIVEAAASRNAVDQVCVAIDQQAPSVSIALQAVGHEGGVGAAVSGRVARSGALPVVAPVARRLHVIRVPFQPPA